MRVCVTLLLCGLFVAPLWAQDKAPAKTDKAEPTSAKVTAETAKGPLDFTMVDIDGKDVPLSKYKGQVLLIVNVASKCGLTPQYEQLQELQKRYADRGLRILGFPANNFREQEPGSNKEIKEFCQTKYHVTFDMFSKVSVKGDDKCELYKFLTSEQKNPGRSGEIAWNFTKFLVGRDGQVVARFEPKTTPNDPEVTKAVEAALGPKTPGGGADSPAKVEAGGAK